MRRGEFLWIVFLGLCALFALSPAGRPSVVAAQGDPVMVRITPAEAEVTTEGTFAVAVEVVDVTDLYAFSAVLAFNPAVVQVVDVDPLIDGVQVGLGTFMEPGVAILNLANNPAGVIEFAFTQLNPSPPKSGSGNLMVITFTGVAEGEVTPLIFMDLQLARSNGTEIVAAGVPGEIAVLEQPPPGPTATIIPTLPVGITLPTATFAPTLPATTPVPTSTNVTSPPSAPTATGIPAVATSNPSAMTPTPGMTAAAPTAQSTGAASSPTPAPDTAMADNPAGQPPTISPGATLALAVAQDEAGGNVATPAAEAPAVTGSATTESVGGATASAPASPIGQGEGAPGSMNGNGNGSLSDTAENRANPGIWLIGLGLLLALLGAGMVFFLRSR